MKMVIETDPKAAWHALVPPNNREIAPYLASTSLIEALNLAILLKRPLLLQGEPGSGKTQLAKALAWKLYGQEYSKYYREWPVSSTSKASEGRYSYDHVGRLRDAQLMQGDLMSPAEKQAAREPMRYLKPGVLWQAFTSEKPTVLLIDEIDKADIDFPNDLLLELDQKYFYVDELPANEKGEAYKVAAGEQSPIIIVTSNRERALPDAFLRRCIFHYIEFPQQDQLEAIVLSHFERMDKVLKPGLEKKAVAAFNQLRSQMAAEKREGGKLVSTSELLDWCQALQAHQNEPEMAKEIESGLERLPFVSVLLKTWEDHQRWMQRMARMGK